MITRQARPALAALLIAATSPASIAQGENAPGPNTQGVNSAVQSPRAIRLNYVLYGHGFHVLDVVVDLALTPQSYSVRLHDHSVGFLSLMLHTDVTSTATGRFIRGGVQPLHFESSGYSRGAQRDTVLDFDDGNPVVKLVTPVETNRDPVAIGDTRGSIDTLSAMADMVHQVEENGHCDGHALVFDGLRLSRVSSRTVGQQTVPQDDRSPYGGTALRCDFVSLEIGGFLHNEDEAKMRLPQHGTAWVTTLVQGAPPLPVRIMFENPKLGMATMFLQSVEENPDESSD